MASPTVHIVFVSPAIPEPMRRLFSDHLHSDAGVDSFDAESFELLAPFVKIAARSKTDGSVMNLWLRTEHVLAAAEVPVGEVSRLGFHP